MNIACWLFHDWKYDNPDPELAWTRKCLRCGARQRISMTGSWVEDDRPEKKQGGEK